MLQAFIYLIVVCAAAALIYWAIDALGTPEPIRRIVRVAVVCLAVLVIIILFLDLLGMGTGGVQLPSVN